MIQFCIPHIRFLVRNGRGVRWYIIFPNIKLSETRIILILIKRIKMIYKVNSRRKDLPVYQPVIFYIRFLQGKGCFSPHFSIYNSLIINSFTRSITDASIEARYICVVAMDSCPSASEMTLTGTFFDLAMVAQLCRET